MTNREIALDVVCKATRVSRKLIVSRSRLGRIVEARNLYILLLWQTGTCDEVISWILNRSRSSVTSSRHAALRRVDASDVFRNKYLQIKNRYEQQKSLRISPA